MQSNKPTTTLTFKTPEEEENMKQSDPGYFEYRKKYKASASNLAGMMGISPYDTQEQLHKYYITGADKPFGPHAQKAAAHGVRSEQDGRDNYMAITGENVHEKGLFSFKDDRRFSASPDGLIYDNKGARVGMIEIKCPHSAYKHAGLKRGRKPDALSNATMVPLDYLPQMMANMKFIGVKWCDYVCWVPGDQISINRVHFSEDAWQYIYKETCKFLDAKAGDFKPGNAGRALKEALLTAKVKKTNPTLPILVRSTKPRVTKPKFVNKKKV